MQQVAIHFLAYLSADEVAVYCVFLVDEHDDLHAAFDEHVNEYLDQ